MSRFRFNDAKLFPSRRTLLKGLGMAPLLLRPSPFLGSGFPFGLPGPLPISTDPFSGSPLDFADIRLKPSYPSKSPLEDVLRRVAAGSDEYLTEKYAEEIAALLEGWSQAIKASPRDLAALKNFSDAEITASPLAMPEEKVVRSGEGIELAKRRFPAPPVAGRERFLEGMAAYLAPFARLETAEFQIVSIEVVTESPLRIRAGIRYGLVGGRIDQRREERVGLWQTEWRRDSSGPWIAQRWTADEETVSRVNAPAFSDVTSQALGGTESYARQMLRGADHWRTVLDGACGIDVYGNNGVAAGDYDGDGFDDLYLCQPAGLPNRLYRNRGDGTFEDATEKSGVGVLDGTACALFADFDNKGVQDLLVVCGSGPLLFLNEGNGRFSLKRDAFQFARAPQGTFTHAAIADYDRDGRLDIYFCLYSYYVGLDQYHYPVPYFDARNGPPNFLLHNEGNGRFTDRTEAAGMNAENDRYSFACAWGDADGNGWPDLYVANDFGRSNLYRNKGDGSFEAVSTEAHVEDPGAGMSASWSDFDNDGKQDIYAANMWSAAGQRVAGQAIFHAEAREDIRGFYRRHARGNSLYRNLGEGGFENVSQKAGVEMGRWSWCSDLWDFDHDGYPDLYVANGYISGPDRNDLGSFFWRQVVAKSPDDSTPSQAYEHGWNALNELIRSDSSWSGYERNVLFANNRDGSFTEASGAVGMDFLDDSRSFALADLDHDGRLEVVLKNRNAPQLRILHNDLKEIGQSISFRLRGVASNRDAIGSAITLEAGRLRQTRYLQAGSGFLAQHAKEVFFGIGKPEGPMRATVRWPNGATQIFEGLPAGHRIEIVEGAANHRAVPFSAAPAIYRQPGESDAVEALPSVAETWLIEPLKAPEFALPDIDGRIRELREFRGGFALLSFWSANAPRSIEALKLLAKQSTALAAAGLKVLAMNLDEPAALESAQSTARQLPAAFALLFASAEMAGIYNIVYRYLFDRRRDLPIPSSMLLDAGGMIVKLYQGPLDAGKLFEDIRNCPTTGADRLQKALPFAGSLYQAAFQRNDFTYGVAMFQHGYLDQAAASFEQVVAAKPDDAEAYYNLGTLNLRRNNYQKAGEYLERALKLRPEYPEAWNNLGMIAAQAGKADEAVRSFQQALSQRPSYAVALLNLGNVYRRQGSAAQAQDCLTRALALQPDDPEANYSLGMFYAQQNEPKSASQYLQKAIELRPDYPEALNNFGVLLVRAGEYGRAEEQFQTCIRRVPGFDQSYLNLARLYTFQKDKQKALRVLNDLLQLQPQNANAKKAVEMLESQH
jgi:tetratricopeptide (TPR) repeat protein